MATVSRPPDIEEVSFEDFMRIVGDAKAEWVRGKVLAMSPVNLRHQALSEFLIRTLGDVVEQIGGRLLFESFVMREGDLAARCPDVMVVLPQNLGRLTSTVLEGPADLIVEVVSPDSVGRDRGEKFVEYEALGVPEYWILDPDRSVAEFYCLEDGRYRLMPLDDGLFRSRTLPKVSIDPGWFWQEKLPRVRQVLKTWGLD